MASAWGDAFGSAWGSAWGTIVSEPVSVGSRGGGYPDGLAGSGRRERDDERRARKASEERRYKRLKKLDEALEEAWLTLHPEERIAIEEQFRSLPDSIRPGDVRVSDLPRPPVIDLERAAMTTGLYRDAVAALERAITARQEQIADEEDIEILLLASL